MRRSLAILVLVALAMNIPAAAQSGTSLQRLAGSWQLTASLMPKGVLTVSVVNGKLACQLTYERYGFGDPEFARDPRHTSPVACGFAGGTLTFSYYIQDAKLFTRFSYSGTEQLDGTFAGSASRIRTSDSAIPAARTRIDSIKWTATRVVDSGK